MIDLHTHTNYSDGTWDLSRLLKEAEIRKINVLSITDHDTIKAYKELETIDYKKIYSGKIITGVEFTTVYNGVSFHMLAYDFDYKKLDIWIQKNYENNKPNLQKEFDYMIKSCKENNIKLDIVEYKSEIGWPVDIIFEEIKKHPENKKFFRENEWNNVDVFFNSCITNKKFPAFVDFSIHYPSAELVTEAEKKQEVNYS